MTERHNTLMEAWSDEDLVFGGLTVAKPSTHRLNALMRRRNKWIADSPREQTDIEALVEWFFVLTRTKEEMTKFFRVSLDEWEGLLDDFMACLDEDALEEFKVYFTKVSESLEAGSVKDADGPGKSAEGRVLSHVS